MQNRWSLTRRPSWALVLAPILAAGLAVAVAGPAAAHSHAARTVSASQEQFTVTPNPTNNLDCNGWSLTYKPVDPAHRQLCTDPRGAEYGQGYSSSLPYSSKGRFVNNGHYVGHDEPSVKFISSAAGSGNTMTYFMTLPSDPATPATNTGSVTNDVVLNRGGGVFRWGGCAIGW